mmetsp:Transcript_131463/g.228505  ORF Transcript_131463/g.228505 Transcript_131463/m.228505 type:complete len:216 (-) Transcript_131463:490-1137(-)
MNIRYAELTFLAIWSSSWIPSAEYVMVEGTVTSGNRHVRKQIKASINASTRPGHHGDDVQSWSFRAVSLFWCVLIQRHLQTDRQVCFDGGLSQQPTLHDDAICTAGLVGVALLRHDEKQLVGRQWDLHVVPKSDLSSIIYDVHHQQVVPSKEVFVVVHLSLINLCGFGLQRILVGPAEGHTDHAESTCREMKVQEVWCQCCKASTQLGEIGIKRI